MQGSGGPPPRPAGFGGAPPPTQGFAPRVSGGAPPQGVGGPFPGQGQPGQGTPQKAPPMGAPQPPGSRPPPQHQSQQFSAAGGPGPAGVGAGQGPPSAFTSPVRAPSQQRPPPPGPRPPPQQAGAAGVAGMPPQPAAGSGSPLSPTRPYAPSAPGGAAAQQQQQQQFRTPSPNTYNQPQQQLQQQPYMPQQQQPGVTNASSGGLPGSPPQRSTPVPPSAVSNPTRDLARKRAQQAVQEDVQGNYEAALALYKEAVDAFRSDLPTETNPTQRAYLEKKIAEYSGRASKLESFLEQEKKEREAAAKAAADAAAVAATIPSGPPPPMMATPSQDGLRQRGGAASRPAVPAQSSWAAPPPTTTGFQGADSGSNGGVSDGMAAMLSAAPPSDKPLAFAAGAAVAAAPRKRGSWIGFCCKIGFLLFFLWIALLAVLVMYPHQVQPYAIYLHWLDFPPRFMLDLNSPERYLMLRHGTVRSIRIKSSTPYSPEPVFDPSRTPLDGTPVNLMAWHFLPKSARPLLMGDGITRDEGSFDASLNAGSRVFLYFHGNAGNLGAPARVRAYRLLRHADPSAHILALEYRGFGGSDKVLPTTNGIKQDLAAAYWYLLQAGVPAQNIVVVGHSLGTGFASWLCALEAFPAPKGLLLIAPYTSIPDASLDYGTLPLLKVLKPLLSQDRREWIKSKIVIKWDTRKLIRSVADRVPVLMVHGDKDHDIPISHSLDLFSAALEPSLGGSGNVEYGSGSEKEPDYSSDELPGGDARLLRATTGQPGSGGIWLLEIRGAGHRDLQDWEVFESVLAGWVASLEKGLSSVGREGKIWEFGTRDVENGPKVPYVAPQRIEGGSARPMVESGRQEREREREPEVRQTAEAVKPSPESVKPVESVKPADPVRLRPGRPGRPDRRGGREERGAEESVAPSSAEQAAAPPTPEPHAEPEVKEESHASIPTSEPVQEPEQPPAATEPEPEPPIPVPEPELPRATPDPEPTPAAEAASEKEEKTAEDSDEGGSEGDGEGEGGDDGSDEGNEADTEGDGESEGSQ